MAPSPGGLPRRTPAHEAGRRGGRHMGDTHRPREPVSSDPLLLTPEEAAEALRVGRTTIYALMKAGDLRSVHIGRSCRISRAELERYVQHLQAPPPPQPARTRSRRRRTSTDQDRLFDVVHSRPERP
ncbi:helix-turn-helix domain-containing protein [Geodermatophilus sp. URMC 60]